MWIAAAAVALSLLPAAPQDSPLTIEKLIADGRYREALTALAAQPASTRRHLLASQAHDALNDPAAAVREAEAALALAPRSEAAHLQLGQIFLGRNTPDAALEVFTDALALLPDSVMLRLGKGLALKDLARYADAETELRTCVAWRPDLAVAFDALATVHLHTKSFDELASLARAFRTRRADDYRGPYYLAAALDGQRAGPGAIEAALAESIRLNPRFAASHALLGKLRLREGDAGGAIPHLEVALRLRPDYSPAALQLAQAYQKAGRVADAEKAFQHVRELKDRERVPAPTLLYHRGK